MFLLLNLSRYAFVFLSKICNFIPEFFASDSNELTSVSFVVVLITNSCSVQNDVEADFSLFAADTFFFIYKYHWDNNVWSGIFRWICSSRSLWAFSFSIRTLSIPFFSNLFFLVKYDDIFSTISLLTPELTP